MKVRYEIVQRVPSLEREIEISDEDLWGMEFEERVDFVHSEIADDFDRAFSLDVDDIEGLLADAGFGEYMVDCGGCASPRDDVEVRRGNGWDNPGEGIPCFIAVGRTAEKCLACGKHIRDHHGTDQYRCLPFPEPGERTEYKLVTGGVGSLEREINDLLAEGWDLFGQPTMVGTVSLAHITQALVRKGRPGTRGGGDRP